MGKEVVCGFSMRNMGHFPACVQDNNSEKTILGEVWQATDETLKRLDRLEGYPNFYDRVEVDTFAGKAWIYINNKAAEYPEISSGDWKNRQ